MKTARQIERDRVDTDTGSLDGRGPERLGRPAEVSIEEIELGLRRAHALRSEAAWNLGGAIAGWLRRGLGGWLDRIRRGHAVRAAIRELDALDDRTLRDIGVSRAEIPFLARSLHAASARQPGEAESQATLRTPAPARFRVAPANDECCAEAA